MINLVILECKHIELSKTFFTYLGFRFVNTHITNSEVQYNSCECGLSLCLMQSTKQNVPLNSIGISISPETLIVLQQNLPSWQLIKLKQDHQLIDPDGRVVFINFESSNF